MRVTIIRCAALAVLGVLGTASIAEPQWRITSADQKTSLTIGVLAQPQVEWLTAADDGDAIVDAPLEASATAERTPEREAAMAEPKAALAESKAAAPESAAPALWFDASGNHALEREGARRPDVEGRSYLRKV